MHYTFPQRCFPKHRFFATKSLRQNTLTNATSPWLKKHKPPEAPKTVVLNDRLKKTPGESQSP